MSESTSRVSICGYCRAPVFLSVMFAIIVAVPISLMAATPVAVWDGLKSDSNFSSLTRTAGDVTYTMAVNSENAAVSSGGDYITIGSENQKWTVTITADAAGAFGTTSDSGFTLIALVANAGTSESSNRAILNYYSSSQQAGAALAQTPTGCVFPVVNGNAYTGAGRVSEAGTLKSDGTIQTLAMSYGTNPQGGTAFYVNGGEIYQEAAMTSSYFTTPDGVSLGGVASDGSGLLYAMKGMKIYAVAIFTNRLSAAEVSSYTFPSTFSGNSTVSAINDMYGTASEINVFLADGAVLTGDTTFNASTVHFYCDGSFAMTAPEGNTATFDFSNVAGTPALVYSGALPTVSGNVFTSNSIPTFVTDSTRWTGVIWLKNIGVEDFTVNPYGNESSIVRLSTIWGWIRAPGDYAFTNSVPVELCDEGSSPALNLTNGNSANTTNPNRCTVFKKLSGNGTLNGNSSADKVVVVVQDASDFAGGIGLNNGKIVVFGETMPAQNSLTAGSIVVMEGASVTAQPASGTWWATGGIKVDGELRASGLDKFGGGTYITTSDIGTMTLANTNNVNDNAVDYARIQGTGTLKLVSSGNFYRCVSKVNFPTNMTVQTELEGGFLLRDSGATYTVGSLAGSGYIRSDWGDGDRNMRILQSTDTTYSGFFDANIDRIGTVTVAPGVSSAGTLTLSAEQTASNNLVVATNASVNITGAWVGPVSVAGTIAGTGAIDGALTVSDGATVFVDDAEPLMVSGNVTLSGNIAIVVADDVDVTRLPILRVTGDSATLDAGGASFTVRKASGKAVVACVRAKSRELCLSNVGFHIHLQ